MTKDIFGSGAGIIGTLDDPYHDPDLGCTKDPKTCENFLICFCEEMQSRARREQKRKEGINHERKN